MISTKMLKGMQGESLIREKLLALQRVYQFEFVYDMPVEKTNGDFQQCDFIVLSIYGDFALEIKNWQGVLECRGCDRYWVVDVNGRIVYPLNPVLQNASHIRWIQESYGIRCENIVLFSDACQLINQPMGVYNFRDLDKLFTLNPVRSSLEEVQRKYQVLMKAKSANNLKAIAQRFVKWETGIGG